MSHLLPCFFLSTFSTFTMSQWLVDQRPRTAARNGVRNNTFWFIIPTFTAPFASLYQGIAQVACYDSFVVCIVHIHITCDKDQFQSKTYSQWSSEGYWVLVCRELVTSKYMHSLYWIWFLSETWGATRSTFSTNWVLKHSEYMMDC